MPGAAPITQFRDEMVLGFGQRQSLLAETATREAVIKGNQAVFMVASSTGTAVTRGVNGRIPYGDNDNAQVTVTLKEAHAGREMTGFNIFQSQGNQRAIMQMNVMAVINRDIDAKILAALGTGSLDTGSAATASLTLVSKAIAQLGNNGVPIVDGNGFAVISPAMLMYLQALPTWASADYVEVKPFVSFPGWNASMPGKNAQRARGWHRWMEINWIVSNQLSGVGTNSCTCLMFHRDALGYAVDTAGMDVAAGYEDKHQLSWARCSLFHEAVLLQNSGVVRMIHDDSAFVAT